MFLMQIGNRPPFRLELCLGSLRAWHESLRLLVRMMRAAWRD